MTANSIDLKERQVVNIADGKCLGNLKDIELNLWTGRIESLVLPATNGFWYRLQHSGELIISWDKVVRIGVDVILVDAPELSEYDTLFQKNRQKSPRRDTTASQIWQQEVAAYQDELAQNNIIILNQEDYREVK